MTRCVAFLRAVNVGGRTVRMDALRVWFEALGARRVETYIASGNVLFDTTTRDRAALERRIEARLMQELGFEVDTFVRSAAELAAIVAHPAFTPAMLDGAQALNVAFLREPLGAAAQAALQALHTDIDAFHAHGRELWWLCRRRQSESAFSNAVLERRLGQRATLRGLRTVQTLAEKAKG